LQIVVLLWVYTIYDQLRRFVTGSSTLAMSNAADVVHLERLLGLNVEWSVQHAAAAIPGLLDACAACYTVTHIVAPPLALLLLYRRAPDRYREWRNAFVAMLGLAVVCFWLYPLMPPRLFPGGSGAAHAIGLAHTRLTSITGPSAGSTPGWSGFTNPFAAMPSLHVAWAVWAGMAVRPVLRRRWARAIAVGYPIAMALSVVVTANHWLFDLAAGAVLVPVTVGAVRVASSRRVSSTAPTVPAPVGV
jgi:hypothetical protein